MTYREQLNKVNELGISICDLEVANELDAVLEFGCTDKEFEDLCEFSKYIYLKAESLTPNAIARCIDDMVMDEGKTLDEIIEMNKWDFIEEASIYLD